jgi:hypothetical protein
VGTRITTVQELQEAAQRGMLISYEDGWAKRTSLKLEIDEHGDVYAIGKHRYPLCINDAIYDDIINVEVYYV